jgi:hypothetical protein
MRKNAKKLETTNETKCFSFFLCLFTARRCPFSPYRLNDVLMRDNDSTYEPDEPNESFDKLCMNGISRFVVICRQHNNCVKYEINNFAEITKLKV